MLIFLKQFHALQAINKILLTIKIEHLLDKLSFFN